jgi:hypothetical protein
MKEITILVHRTDFDNVKKWVADNVNDVKVTVCGFCGGKDYPNETVMGEIKVFKKELIKCG